MIDDLGHILHSEFGKIFLLDSVKSFYYTHKNLIW